MDKTNARYVKNLDMLKIGNNMTIKSFTMLFYMGASFFFSVAKCAQPEHLDENARGVLIFLDQEENEERGLGGPIWHSFAQAFVQDAGPIIVSATLIKNMFYNILSDSITPDQCKLLYTRLIDEENPTDAQKQQLHSIFTKIINFSEESARKWIIKKISPALYLLLPHSYLGALKLSPSLVSGYISDEDYITSTEGELGLKVNHMRTVTAQHIREAEPSLEEKDLFLQQVYNPITHKSHIFVTRDEYPTKLSFFAKQWSIYLEGHGGIYLENETSSEEVVADLSYDDFRKFLTFLNYKIVTKLFYYNSCYGSGVAHEKIFKRQGDEPQATYSFPIISQTLTDGLSSTTELRCSFKKEKLHLVTSVHYDCFFNAIVKKIIDYAKLSSYLVPETISDINSTLSQIKFPGLPWFSVIDQSKVVSIGTIMAQTRTKPLLIKENSEAVLVYASWIPFSLNFCCRIPIVSMIPGPALHYLHLHVKVSI